MRVLSARMPEIHEKPALFLPDPYGGPIRERLSHGWMYRAFAQILLDKCSRWM
jgi:hypothetical protein